ncbi:MAG: T9SS type A sorting domain-containing protein [Bacteroidota bacterium]|nr:T9SS type A sorting domain-containing protein [Bacteroidota bacterium]
MKNIFYHFLLVISFSLLSYSQCDTYIGGTPSVRYFGASVLYNFGASLSTNYYAPINAAASIWTNAGCGVSLVYNASVSKNLISQEDLGYFGSNTDLAKSYIYPTTDGKIYSSDMLINSNVFITWYTGADANGIPGNAYDLQSVATHEFGHWFDLADKYDAGTCGTSIMNKAPQGGPRMTLQTVDKDAVRAIYGGTTGVEDYIFFYPVPQPSSTSFAQNSSLSYSASFADVYPYGDYIVGNYSWSLLIQHGEGDYIASNGTTNSIQSWQFTFGTLPYGYYWLRDGSGNVKGRVKVTGTDNHGISHTAYYDITIVGVPSNTTSGTLTHNETWGGEHTLIGNISVPANITLKILPDAIIRFPSNASLTINGIINVAGYYLHPITLTSTSGITPGSWGSIVLNGTGASGSNLNYFNMYYGTDIQAIGVPSVTIQNSHIEKTINGIDFSASNGSLISNTIKNVQDHGIIANNGSQPSCYHNTIFKSSTDNNYHSGAGILFSGGSHDYIWNNDIRGFNWGVGAIWGSSPQFGHPSNAGINNRITDCLAGLEIYESSNPIVGINYYNSSYYYGNSIYGNGLAAEVTSHSTVYAHNVYWGGSYPSYSADGTSSFYSYPYILYTDPWINIPLPSQSIINPSVLAHNILSKTVSIASTILNSPASNVKVNHLFEGIAYREQGKHKDAFNVFVKMITDNEEPDAALVELYNTYSDSTKDDVCNYLKIASQGKLSIAPHLLSTIHLRRGEINEAKAVNESIIKKHPNTEDATHAMIQQLYIALYHEKDFVLASSLLTEIQKQKNVDKNIEVSLAQHALDSYVNADKLKKGSKAVEQVPNKLDLMQNYPNPFNPSTTFRISLPESKHVQLSVYNMLGQKVATVVDDLMQAGYNDVRFDGSSLASGIYIYRLQIEKEVRSGKMMLMK